MKPLPISGYGAQASCVHARRLCPWLALCTRTGCFNAKQENGDG